MWYKNIAGRFFGLVTKHACDGQTDRQNYDSQDRASIAASRGKNLRVLWSVICICSHNMYIARCTGYNRKSHIYTVNHKKRDILFLTTTLANLNQFLQFLYRFNREEILHAIVVKFTTSP